jgi:hypothetical protein
VGIDLTELFEFPFPDGEEKPDGPAQIGALAKAIENRLEVIELLIGTPGAPAAPAAGQIVVVNGTNDPVYKAVTGDIGINSAGVTTIGASKVLEGMLGPESVATAKVKNLAITVAKLANEAVETAKLAGLGVTTAKLAELAVTAQKIAAEAIETGKIKNGAVTTAKIAAGAVTETLIADGAVTSRKAKLTCGEVRATEGLNLTEAPQDVPGTERKITPAVASALMIWPIFDFNYVNACQTFGFVNVDGKNQPNFAGGFQPTTTAEGAPQSYVISLTAATHTIKLQAQREKGAALLEAGITGYTYLLLAA